MELTLYQSTESILVSASLGDPIRGYRSGRPVTASRVMSLRGSIDPISRSIHVHLTLSELVKSAAKAAK